MSDHGPITIRDLYPELSEQQLKEAENNLRRYAQIIWRMYERLEAEGKPWPESEPTELTNLTASEDGAMIPAERSNSPTPLLN